MTRFKASNQSDAVVPASRTDIWEVLTDPELLAALTPLVGAITVDGDHWCWQLEGISALGVSVAPSFTERMNFEEGTRIEFTHDPPEGSSERAGAEGLYTLDDVDGGTRLGIDITIGVDLPLPAISRRAVERVMTSAMARTGDRFAANLYAHLGITDRVG